MNSKFVVCALFRILILIFTVSPFISDVKSFGSHLILFYADGVFPLSMKNRRTKEVQQTNKQTKITDLDSILVVNAYQPREFLVEKLNAKKNPTNNTESKKKNKEEEEGKKTDWERIEFGE